MRKNYFATLVLVLMSCCSSLVQAQIRDSARVYDIVTDADDFYLFAPAKPCFHHIGIYDWAPQTVMLQEYVSACTVTVYGVAITCEKMRYGLFDTNQSYCWDYRALLMNRIGPSPINPYAFTFALVDSVSLCRSHPRFCWFQYINNNNCTEKDTLTAPCYEFYFDTPAQINRTSDTFYVGRFLDPMISGLFVNEYGGEYSTALPSTIYRSPSGYEGGALDYFFHCDGYQDHKWGVAFPIIGFRCKPVPWYRLESYIVGSRTLEWANAEEGTVYNVRLVGEDGSDTTFVTTDTTLVLPMVSDSVRYTVMLRKQCHYATSNYDTTVSSEWLSYIHFGTTILPPDTTTLRIF